MKPLSPSAARSRGSALLGVCILAFVCAALIGLVLTYLNNVYRTSARRVKYQQVKTAANNEMEYLFFSWAGEMDKTSGLPVAQRLANDSKIVSLTADPRDTALAQNPFLGSDSIDTKPALASSVDDVVLARAMMAIPMQATGSVSNQSGISRTGNVKYFTARTRVRVQDPNFGQIEVRLGRRFTYQSISACAGAIYYQNDMEFGAAGTMDIYGDIQSNGSIYMGAQNGAAHSLDVHGKVFYVTTYNGDANNLIGSQYSIASSASSTLKAPTFSESRASQVAQMRLPDNMLGFNDPSDPSTDPATIAAANTTAYPNGVNDVYRALVSPPPTDTSGTLIPEPKGVADSRLFNKAGLRITVDNGVLSVVYPDPVTNTTTDYTSYFSSVVPTGEIRKSVFDKREGKPVNMTTIDVGLLKHAIESLEAATASSTKWKFNGVLYVYDKTPTTNSLNGIRLKNAESTPNFDYTSASNDTATGFTVATENGLYIQGDYNTAVDSSNKTNRAAVMADAVTVLSEGWDDDNSASPLASRPATENVTINSAVMSGNTASQVDASGNFVVNGDGLPIQSGGVQNLVRYLEDWYNTNHTATIRGSIAQLFSSQYFNSVYKGTWANDIYIQPVSRRLEFDYQLAANPPNGVPNSTIKYYRGDLFEW
jgi:hypothetical protein